MRIRAYRFFRRTELKMGRVAMQAFVMANINKIITGDHLYSQFIHNPSAVFISTNEIVGVSDRVLGRLAMLGITTEFLLGL